MTSIGIMISFRILLSCFCISISAANPLFLDAILDGNVTAKISSMLESKINSTIDHVLKARLDSNLTANLVSQIAADINSKINTSLAAKLNAVVDSKLNSTLDAKLHADLEAEIIQNITSKIAAEIGAKLDANINAKVNSTLDSDNRLDMKLGVRNDETLTDCLTPGLKRSFTNIDHALYGYNVYKGFPLAIDHDPGFTRPIFRASYKTKKQSADCVSNVPEGYHVIPDLSCQTALTSTTLLSLDDLKQMIGNIVEVPNGVWGMPFSASDDFKKMSEMLETEAKVLIISSANCQVYYTNIDEVTPPPFDNSFIMWIEKLNSFNATDETYIQFLLYYGTHFIKYAVFGARFTNEYSLKNDSYEGLKEPSEILSVETAANYAGFRIQEQSNSTEDHFVTKFKERSEKRTVTIGAPPPSNGDAESWATSVKDTPVPYRYTLESIEQLFTMPYMQRYEQFTQEDVESMRKNLEYVQLRYSNELFTKTMKHVCRVYKSAISLKNGLSLGQSGRYQRLYEADTQRSCIQTCMDDNSCEAMVFFHSNRPRCDLYKDVTNNQISKSAKASTFLLPHRMKTTGISYKMLEGFRKMRIRNLKPNNFDDSQKIFLGYKSGVEQCEERCVQDHHCVASYYWDVKHEVFCLLMNDVMIAQTNWVLSKGEHNFHYVTFFKTC